MLVYWEAYDGDRRIKLPWKGSLKVGYYSSGRYAVTLCTSDGRRGYDALAVIKAMIKRGYSRHLETIQS